MCTIERYLEPYWSQYRRMILHVVFAMPLSSLLHHATISPASLSPSVFVLAAAEQPNYLLPFMHVSRCTFSDAHQEGTCP